MKNFTLLLIALMCFTFGQSQNLALSKTTASSSGNSALAVDGNMSTRWESAFTDTEWWSVDLGASYDIGQVIILWEGAYGDQYTIDISPDNINWTTIYTEAAGNGGTDDLSVTGTGRYIRYNGTHRALPYGHSFWEFQVYEAIDPLTDATLNDLTVNGTTVSGFLSGTLTYDIELPNGTVAVPTVVGTPTQSAPATAVTTDAVSLPGSSSVLVTAQDGTTTNTYALNFTIAPPPVTLPLDFSNADQDFEWDPSGGTGGDAIINAISEKLEIFGNGNEWDNAYINFSGVEVVDLSNDAANTISFTIQSTTALAGEVHTHLIKLTGAGVYETDFTTTGQEVKTVFIDPPALGDLTELRIFVDRNSTDGGTYLVDDIALFVDTEVPTAFTASVGTIGAFGVELLLNATDNSGTVTYNISYNAGANTVQTTGESGVQKAFTVSGLTPETAYSFEVSASDGTGNTATNNPITGLDATTIEDTNTECAGISSSAQQPGFSNGGYSYEFETLGNGDVRMTFELLEAGAAGVVAYSWREAPFQELPMSVTGTVATIDLTGYVDGEDISHAVKFVWAAGGFGVTEYFTYTVGEDCSALGINNFVAASFTTYPNPTQSNWTIKTQNVNMSSIRVYDVLGKNVLSIVANDTETVIDGSNLKSGLYFAQIQTASGIKSIKLVKK